MMTRVAALGLCYPARRPLALRELLAAAQPRTWAAPALERRRTREPVRREALRALQALPEPATALPEALRPALAPQAALAPQVALAPQAVLELLAALEPQAVLEPLAALVPQARAAPQRARQVCRARWEQTEWIRPRWSMLQAHRTSM